MYVQLPFSTMSYCKVSCFILLTVWSVVDSLVLHRFTPIIEKLEKCSQFT